MFDFRNSFFQVTVSAEDLHLLNCGKLTINVTHDNLIIYIIIYNYYII